MAISSIPSDIFRKAEETDIERIWQIIGQAKAQMQRLGSQQWDENYPAIEHIRQDIQDGNGYVICREDRVVAYGVISFDGEPVYKDIEGKWSNDLPYVIVHRLAIADEMKRQGMAKQFMLQAEEVSRKKGVYNFRVDTKYDNAYMLRLIDTLGFKYCGEVYYRNNSARKAFEKTIRPYSHPIGISDYTIREATFEDATLIFEAIDKTGKICASGCLLSTGSRVLQMNKDSCNPYWLSLTNSAIRSTFWNKEKLFAGWPGSTSPMPLTGERK